MRASLLVALVVVVAAPQLAQADAPFELHDRGDRVEVIARGWTAVDPSAVTVNRERLELVVAGGLTAARQSYEDRTVRRVEVRGREPRVLSIKLRTEHDRVVKLAPLATVSQIGDELHVVIPRAVPRPLPAAPASTAASPVAATAAPPTPAPTVAPAVAVAAPAAPSMVAPAASPARAPAAIEPPVRPRVAASATGSRWWLVLTGLALVGGGGALLARKRKRAPAAVERIEVIDSRPLGGKARVVWLGAGDRELVVAVSAQQVRLLGQWRRTRDGASEPAELDGLPRAALARGSATRLKTVPAVPAAPASPAVSGILRLRDRPSPLADDLASGDVGDDEQWARDILAATGGRK